MADKSELLDAFPYSRILPDDQIDWFLSQCDRDAVSSAGETYLRQGDPADAMFVMLEGQLQARGEIGWRNRSCSTWKPGDVTGVLPFSRMKTVYRERPGRH